MLGSTILDVAIGLIFVYLLLSLISSAVKELIEAWLKKRAVDLERGLRELLGDPQGNGFVKKLFDHPLICVLYRGWYDNKDQSIFKGSNLPSYIPARSFALAMMDIIKPADSVAPVPPPAAGNVMAPPIVVEVPQPHAENNRDHAQPNQALNVVAPPIVVEVPQPPAGPPLASQTQALRAAIQSTTGAQTPANAQSVGLNQAHLNQVSAAEIKKQQDQQKQDKHVQQALLALVDASGNDIEKVRENIEAWFNSAMDRVSGWYKRWTQVVIFIVGLVLTIIMNADTLAIMTSLSQDKNSRELLVASAQGIVAKKETGILQTSSSDLDEKKFKEIRDNMAKLGAFGLPIGWNSNDPRSMPSIATVDWFLKLFGWLITALAISLGAPFWFDLLNKFINIRSSLKPKDDKPNTPSETKPVKLVVTT